jgi:hypothetical protein
VTFCTPTPLGTAAAVAVPAPSPITTTANNEIRFLEIGLAFVPSHLSGAISLNARRHAARARWPILYMEKANALAAVRSFVRELLGDSNIRLLQSIIKLHGHDERVPIGIGSWQCMVSRATVRGSLAHR